MKARRMDQALIIIASFLLAGFAIKIVAEVFV